MERERLDREICDLALENGKQSFLPTSGPSHEVLNRFGVFNAGLSRHRPPFEICRTNHAFHCVFFCISGEAKFVTEKGRFEVKAGDSFLVPMSPHRYWTDSEWKYIWLNFKDEGHWRGWRDSGPVRKRATHLDHLVRVVEAMLDHAERWENDEIMEQWAALLVTYLGRELLEPNSKLKSRLAAVWREVKRAPSYPWNIERLAQMAHMSVTHFKRSNKDIYSATPGDILTQIRLERALDIMRATDAKLDNVAEQTGYSTGFALSKAFSRFYGASPRKIAHRDAQK